MVANVLSDLKLDGSRSVLWSYSTTWSGCFRPGCENINPPEQRVVGWVHGHSPGVWERAWVAGALEVGLDGREKGGSEDGEGTWVD